MVAPLTTSKNKVWQEQSNRLRFVFLTWQYKCSVSRFYYFYTPSLYHLAKFDGVENEKFELLIIQNKSSLYKTIFQQNKISSKTNLYNFFFQFFKMNPWQVESLDAFSYLCCPECVYRCQEATTFQV